MSFRKIIILSVISVYLFFCIILFGIFNSFYIKNTKEKLKGENAFSKKVAIEFLEKEKEVLLKQATQIGQTPYVYVALWTNKLLAVRDVRLISDEQDRLEMIQAQVMNPLKYMKLVNEESEKLYGSNISEVEKRGLAFYTKYGGKELKKAASSRSYPAKFIDTGKENYLVDAVGGVGRPGTDIKFVQSIGDEFYLKSIHNPNKTRGFGAVVNGRELGIEVLKDIKNIVNKEVLLVKDDKIVCSTLFSDVKTKERIKVDKEKLYGE